MSGLTVVSWWPHSKGTKLGAVSIAFASGMVVHEITIHAQNGKCWAAPPARIRLELNTFEVSRDANSRPVWDPIVSFTSVEVRRRWSDQVIAAFREAHPDVLPPAEDDLLAGDEP